MNDKNNFPLVLVFYLDREMMSQRQIIEPFVKSVNDAIAAREANMMAFFMPTDDDEWIDCINPQTASKDEMERVTRIIGDLKKNFDIGQGADIGKNDG